MKGLTFGLTLIRVLVILIKESLISKGALKTGVDKALQNKSVLIKILCFAFTGLLVTLQNVTTNRKYFNAF